MGDSSISFNWWLTGRIIYKLIKVKKKKKKHVEIGNHYLRLLRIKF
jgi:hypothetical protein